MISNMVVCLETGKVAAGKDCNCNNCQLVRRDSTERWKRWRAENPEKVAADRLVEKQRWTKRYHEYKKQVLSHYSNGKLQCLCCGESIYEFLTIEHLNGNGRQDRLHKGGNWFYKTLIDAGFPEGYSVLCYNCNCAKQHNKICPHVILRNKHLQQAIFCK